MTIQGFVSKRHETGLYFSRSDMTDYNGTCLRPEPVSEFRHREKVVVTGILERTGCGAELICTNACQDYVLKRDVPSENSATDTGARER